MFFKKLKNNPYLKAIKRPEIYLYKMLINTMYVGIITFIINWVYINTQMHTIKIPNGLHAMLGFVIAMLLVFRTNTAYDRWWEGRKRIQEINTQFSSLVVTLNSSNMDKISKMELFKKFKYNLDQIKNYLKSKNDVIEFHLEQMKMNSEYIREMKNHIKSGNIETEDVSEFRKILGDLMTSVNSCERIKNTPIPFAYYIHIKFCIFIYVITLPFSMFYDLNMWSTLVVMFLYFIIAGTEIISTEIENPFSGEPNDLPVDDLIDTIKEYIK